MTFQANPQPPLSGNDKHWMQAALELAKQAEQVCEVPVGAILVLDNEIIGRGYNQPISSNDPTAHAEIIALRDAAKRLGNYRLINSTMYVTLQPCEMCRGAIRHARVNRVVYGATDTREHLNHFVHYDGGVLHEYCSSQLKKFFKLKREKTV